MDMQDRRSVAITLDEPLHADLVAEVEKQSVYIDTGLLALKVGADRREVVFSVRAGREDEVGERVRRFLDAIRRGFRPVPMKVVARHERANPRPYETDVFAKLVEKGWVLDLGQGQVALAGPALALSNALDRSLADIAVERFGAMQRAYPALIPAEVLARCGYTSSFPQHLSIVSHLDENYDAIERFRSANADQRELRIPDARAFGHPKVCLCPALCYHCYPTLENRKLDLRGHVETANGRIARYESSSMVGLDRLWEFCQRSIIWLGEDGFCNERREWAMELAMELARAWDIDCTIETASDPFFTSVSTAKSFWQRGQDLKFELRAAVEGRDGDGPRTVAAGSFNLHGTYFGTAFNISDASGGPAFSGCASWGLERLVLVVFTQHGLEPAQWPPALRQALGLADARPNAADAGVTPALAPAA
ncbi:hypothetical protein [Ideonella sp.]|uniref:hypothetical protein n=1 Tax=Ideonella sp. TaxID=1929293 RepID=UPI0035ADE074